MIQSATSNHGEAARERLLEAAAACFAARGYAGTSVRDITARARCNVGAVNYHFGSKRNLYSQVFEQRLAELAQRRVSALRSLVGEDALSLERVIETFAEAFLQPLRDSARGRQTLTLLMRDLVDGHLPAQLVAERLIRPTLGALAGAIERVCPGLDERRLALCCHSLVSQLVHVVQVQRLHERDRNADLPALDLDDTLRHIVRFTAAGVRACRECRP